MVRVERPEQNADRTFRNPKILKITERVTLKSVEAIMSNYRDAALAVADLVDNAVDNRIPGKTSVIKIRTNRKELSMGLDKIKRH